MRWWGGGVGGKGGGGGGRGGRRGKGGEEGRSQDQQLRRNSGPHMLGVFFVGTRVDMFIHWDRFSINWDRFSKR